MARLPRRAHLGGAVKVCKKNEKVTKTLLIYGDGSLKAPSHWTPVEGTMWIVPGTMDSAQKTSFPIGGKE